MPKLIQFQSNLLTDQRIQELLKDFGTSGIGIYFMMYFRIDDLSDQGLPLDYLLKLCSRHVRRGKALSIISNYGLFCENEFGLVRPCEQIPAQATPAHATPAQATPAHATPAHGTPAHATPAQATPAQATPARDSLQENIKNNNLFNSKESELPKCHFRKPTVEEVDAYCRQRKNHVEADRFCNFYESKGWMVGKSKMVDWRAAVRTWERREDACPDPTPDRNLDHDMVHSTVTISGGIQYFNGRPLPAGAPPRPSDTAEWDESTQSWFELYR